MTNKKENSLFKKFGRLGKKDIPNLEEEVIENQPKEDSKNGESPTSLDGFIEVTENKLEDVFVEEETVAKATTKIEMEDAFVPEEEFTTTHSSQVVKPIETYTSKEKKGENDSLIETSKIDLEIDSKIPYFFVFGMPSSGKTVMLSGLVYYFKTLAEGQISVLNSNDKENHRRGQWLLNEMKTRVRDGVFVTGTRAIQTDEFVFPNEIQLEYLPDDKKKPTMPFCLVDMSGEDLAKVNFDEGGMSGGELDPRINSYLAHPECNLVFILAIDTDFIKESENLIDRFLDHVESLGHAEVPIIFTVNKWDRIQSDYDNVEEFFKLNLPLLERRRKDDRRETAILDFSIGKVEKSDLHKEGVYKYDAKDSRRLARWMYEVSTGYKMDQVMNESSLSNILRKIKKVFRNG